MAYNISYSTLPTFNSNSIGYTIPVTRYTNVNTWQSVPTTDNPITLTPGIYNITLNVAYRASPNSYAYILLNNTQNNSIFYNGSTYGAIADFTTYQGSNPSTGGDWGAYTTPDQPWYPVAGQQMRNALTGSSSAISLACVVKITTNTQCVGLSYSNGSDVTCHTINAVRIA